MVYTLYILQYLPARSRWYIIKYINTSAYEYSHYKMFKRLQIASLKFRTDFAAKQLIKYI